MNWTERNRELVELMDDPHCEPEKLERTYAQFAAANRLYSNWAALYRRYLRPQLDDPDRTWTLLDIGAGGGDVTRYLVRRMERDGFQVEALALDPDERAAAWFERTPQQSNMRYRSARAEELLAEGETFDFVISNHLLHHLRDEEVKAIARIAEGLCRGTVVFNDIRRSPMAWLGFALTAPLFFRRSFIVTDGLRSVRRSYAPGELLGLLPPGWDVKRVFPFRVVVVGGGDAGCGQDA